MSVSVNEMLSKFMDLSQEEKQIAAEMDAAYKEYTDYCADSEKDLNKKIDEIREKMDKLNFFIDYARDHANPAELEESTTPFDTPEGQLVSIQQTIKLESHDDPNAETLYTKATGKKLYYEQEINRTRQLIDGSKLQAKRQYDNEAAKLNKRKEQHYENVREYVQSPDFSEYLKMLVRDKSAFNSPGTLTLSDNEFISLGQRRVKLSVPMEIEQDLSLKSNGEYNAAARTIGAPFQISVKKGSVLFLEHDERNGQYLLGGVQRLLLNFIKYFGENLSSVLFCDVERYSADCLGNISALGMGINPFIVVPKTDEEIKSKVSKFISSASSAPTPDKVTRILVLRDFPEKYSPDTIEKIVELSKNVEKLGVLLIITHSIPMDAVPAETEIRGVSTVIRSRNGGFWVEKTRESLFWYSAPSDISEDVRRVYIEKRSHDALKAAEEASRVPEPEPAPVPEPAPEPEPEPAPVSVGTVSELELETRPANDFEARPAAEARPVEPSHAVSAPEGFSDFDMGTPAAPVQTPEGPAPVREFVNDPEDVQIVNDIINAPDESFEQNAEKRLRYADEDLDRLSVTEDGETVPAHILFNLPRPKPEEKEYTSSVVSELSATLPPPEPDADDEPETEAAEAAGAAEAAEGGEQTAEQPAAGFDPFEPDFRPRQEIDPEYTYRITDKKVPKEPDMTYRITDHPHPPVKQPEPEPEPKHAPEKPRTSIIETGQRVFGNIVDRFKPSGSSKKSESSGYVHPLLMNDAEKAAAEAQNLENAPEAAPEAPVYDNAQAAYDTNAQQNGMQYGAEQYAPAPAYDQQQQQPAPYGGAPYGAPYNAAPYGGQQYAAAPYANMNMPAPEMSAQDGAASFDMTAENAEAPAEEQFVYKKGVRALPAVPLGKNVNGVDTSFDIGGRITYICGSAGDQRSAITDLVAARITEYTHPDDVELWILDCGDGEMMKYADDPAPHIKYLVCDGSAETAIDFSDLIEAETERRSAMFSENGWHSIEDIPEDVYMPLIVVTICEFPRFSYNLGNSPKHFGKSYISKMSKLLKRAGKYGINFLLIGETFSEGGECPPMLADCTIHSGIVSANRDPAVHLMFSALRLYENEIDSMKRVPAGCAFLGDESGTNGLTLIRVQGEVEKHDRELTAVSEFSQEITEYLDKAPFIGGRKEAGSFDSSADYRKEKLESRSDDEVVLFLGKPCRFMGEYPVSMCEDFGENMLVVAPSSEKENAVLMINAAIRSLKEQGITPEILAFRRNPVYSALRGTSVLEGIEVFEGVKAEEHIRDIVEKFENEEFPNTFQIVLGGDLLAASMEADDMIEELSHALTNGPRVGMHFMLVQSSASQLEEYLPLFRYKAVFACPFEEAELLLRDPECDLTQGGFRFSNDEEELTILPYSI